MPAGISPGKYVALMASALITMFAGSQVMHNYYAPLADLDEYVKREEERRKAVTATEEKKT